MPCCVKTGTGRGTSGVYRKVDRNRGLAITLIVVVLLGALGVVMEMIEMIFCLLWKLLAFLYVSSKGRVVKWFLTSLDHFLILFLS